MPFDFIGRKILVTGAGGGIGRSIVKALMASRGEVYALSKTQANLDSLAKEYPDVHTIQADLSDWEATRTAVDEIGPLDGLVNNAGILHVATALEASKKDLDESLRVNLMAAINVTQSVAKKMVKAGRGGSIVNISSVGAINPVPHILAYSVSKAGLDMASKQFAIELGPHNIRVNSVNPTTVATALLKSEDVNLSVVPSRTPLGRIAKVEECVDLVMFLLSEHSTMITGTTNPIDGGMLANIYM